MDHDDSHPNIYMGDTVTHKEERGCIGIVIPKEDDAEVHANTDENEVTEEEGKEVTEEEGEEGTDENDGDEEEGKEVTDENDGDEEEGEEGADENDDQCRVRWLNGKIDQVQDAEDLTVVDRRFSLGEYLFSVSEPTGLVGVVANLNMSVDLMAPDGTIHKDISTKKLKRVRDFATDDYVVRVPLLGKVLETFEDLTLLFDDGIKHIYKNAHPSRLLPVPVNNFGVDEDFPYHIGQRVKVLYGNKPTHSEGTVYKITAATVHVKWLASAGVGRDSSISLLENQSPSDLTLLSTLIHTIWKVGDWCDTKDGSLGGTLLIVNSRTRVDVVWQDGTVEYGREATTLIPTETPPGDDVLFAEHYVVEKPLDDDGDNNTTEPKRRVGVVNSLNGEQRIAVVRWLKPLQRAEEPRQVDSEETVSFYELDPHPDYDYYGYGDVVVRLSPSAGDSLEDATKQGNDTKHHQQDDVNADISWFGIITGLKDGDFEVTWADGTVSKVGPGAVYVVSDDEPDAAGSEARSDSSMETDGSGAHEIPEEDIGKGSSIEGNSDGSGAHEIPEEDIGKGSSIEGNSDAVTLPLASHSGDSSSYGEREYQRKRRKTMSEGPVLEHGALEGSKSGKSDEPVTSEGDGYSFRRFDISKVPLDHHYVGANEQVEKEWVRKVTGDWNILQKDLPDGIFVRVYEDRMELMRAVIVGPYGTPYQDGLFLFDFLLPPKYPLEPPRAYYRSGGWKLNPNLYENGNICLSLLNTWQGSGNEVWDPKSSSILQVLVSLQGLVLNAKPYFNEAGYDKLIGTVEGEKRSLLYNEDVFLLNCKTMMHLMKNQPKGFEELVKEHFRKRGSHILKACNAYMEGYVIGSLTKDALIVDEPMSANSTSLGCRLAVGKIKAMLESALGEKQD